MAWTAYRLVYQAKSPIHIGWHTLGYIKLTRYYITGKAMWGAMTANITRALGSPGISEYETFGALLKGKILTSYFFPAVVPDSPLRPSFTNKGLFYGDMTESDFERLFIKSYGQTAVLPDTNTAEDESLHESEYISPSVEIKGNQRQVFFVGYVFIKEGANHKGDPIDIQKIKQAISEIFVGGDRKYGWGRLVLFGEPLESKDIFDCKIKDESADTLEISLGANASIPAHLSINSDIKMKGDIEPLVGMEFESGKGFGQKVSKADICWIPGSVADDDKMTLKIGDYGILKKGSNHG